jgi:hypothetical protein
MGITGDRLANQCSYLALFCAIIEIQNSSFFELDRSNSVTYIQDVRGSHFTNAFVELIYPSS